MSLRELAFREYTTIIVKLYKLCWTETLYKLTYIYIGRRQSVTSSTHSYILPLAREQDAVRTHYLPLDNVMIAWIESTCDLFVNISIWIVYLFLGFGKDEEMLLSGVATILLLLVPNYITIRDMFFKLAAIIICSMYVKWIY